MFTEFLEEHFSFLFVNPLLTLFIMLLLVIISFVVDHYLKKLNVRIKEKRLAELKAQQAEVINNE